MNRREFLKKGLEGIIVGIPLISSCGKNPLNSEPELNSNSIIKDNIEYYVQTDKKEYKLGESVEMLYRVTNLRDKAITFKFSVPAESKPYTITVKKNEIFLYHNNIGPFLGVNMYYLFDLQPTEKVEYYENWKAGEQMDFFKSSNPKDILYENLVTGVCEVTGYLSVGRQHDKYVPVSVSINIQHK